MHRDSNNSNRTQQQASTNIPAVNYAATSPTTQQTILNNHQQTYVSSHNAIAPLRTNSVTQNQLLIIQMQNLQAKLFQLNQHILFYQTNSANISATYILQLQQNRIIIMNQLQQLQYLQQKQRQQTLSNKSKRATKYKNNREKNVNHLYAIGLNEFGQLGLRHNKNFVNVLTECIKINKNISIKDINCLYNKTIFTDTNNNYWITGENIDPFETVNITKWSQIEYFNINHINIKKICTTSHAESIFWISDKDQLYGHGRNDHGQLGLVGDNYEITEPQLVPFLFNVLDVKSSWRGSIALCNPSMKDHIIIKHWCSTILNTYIPNDIIAMIKMFHGMNNEVYTTDGYGSWRRIQIETFKAAFMVHNIIKIECGSSHYLFLDSNGNVWDSDDQVNNSLEQIIFPNGVKIKDICCGRKHNLALDNNGRVYSWNLIDVPKLVMLDAYMHVYNIIKIKCGDHHSYLMSDDNKHFLFGENTKNQCTLNDDGWNDQIVSAQFINKIFSRLTNGKTIKDVYLGCRTTMILSK